MKNKTIKMKLAGIIALPLLGAIMGFCSGFSVGSGQFLESEAVIIRPVPGIRILEPSPPLEKPHPRGIKNPVYPHEIHRSCKLPSACG